MIDFKQEAQDISKELVEFRRNFHMHPEASRTEFHTAETVAALLESLGIEVNRDYAGDLPSVVGLLKGGHDGPTVALRAGCVKASGDEYLLLSVPERRCHARLRP